MQFPGKLTPASAKSSRYLSEFNQIQNLSFSKPKLKDHSQKFHLSMQFPGKLPGISKIKNISAITHQNSTKYETFAYLKPKLKDQGKKILYLCIFPANYQASAKSSIYQPLFIGIQPNLKLKLPSAQVSRPKPKKCTYPCSFPANYPVSAKSIIDQPLLTRIHPYLKLKLP